VSCDEGLALQSKGCIQASAYLMRLCVVACAKVPSAVVAAEAPFGSRDAEQRGEQGQGLPRHMRIRAKMARSHHSVLLGSLPWEQRCKSRC